MKLAAFLLFLSMIPFSLAQDAKGGGQLLSQASAREKKEKIVVPGEPTGMILGKRVTYGGFVAELAHAQHPLKMLDLRNPIERGRELENLSFYPRSEKPQGFILFAIKF